MHKNRQSSALALASLLTAALVWGLIWYPYRVMEERGVDGITACLVTYFLATVIGGSAFLRRWREVRLHLGLWVMALAAGVCNIAYVLGVLQVRWSRKFEQSKKLKSTVRKGPILWV